MVVYGVTLDTAEIAIALGIGVSMLFYEKQNLVPGGVIVPGYVALALTYGQVVSVGPTGIFQVIGFIIPGLVANSMERQGITKTIYALTIVSVITYVILYAVTGK